MSGRLTRGLPFAEYLRLASEHFSVLKYMDVSALHYRQAKDHDGKDNPSLRLGRALHSLLLDPTPPEVAIYEGKVRNGKVWDAFEKEHEGKLILRRAEIHTATAMRDAILANPHARDLLSDGEGEVTVEWDMHGLPCRARFDWLRDNGGVVEVKSTRHIAPSRFMREFGSLLYHAQVAFYEYGADEAFGGEQRPPAHVIAVENKPPYDVAVYPIEYDTIEAGQRKVDTWMRTLVECAQSDTWPGVGNELIPMRLSDWALADGLPDVDLDGIGERENDDE